MKKTILKISHVLMSSCLNLHIFRSECRFWMLNLNWFKTRVQELWAYPVSAWAAGSCHLRKLVPNGFLCEHSNMRQLKPASLLENWSVLTFWYIFGWVHLDEWVGETEWLFGIYLLYTLKMKREKYSVEAPLCSFNLTLSCPWYLAQYET